MTRSRNSGGQGRETDDHSEHSCLYLCSVCDVCVCGGGVSFLEQGPMFALHFKLLYVIKHAGVYTVVCNQTLVYSLLYVNTPTTLWANMFTPVQVPHEIKGFCACTNCHVCFLLAHPQVNMSRSSPPMFVFLQYYCFPDTWNAKTSHL